MNCDLHPAALAQRDRARACANDVVAPAAAGIDQSGRVPEAVRQALAAALITGPDSDAVAWVAGVEEVACVSAAAALVAAGVAFGAGGAAEPAAQWSGLRGADVDGLRASFADDPRFDLTVTAVLVGLGRSAVEQAQAALRVKRAAGATSDGGQSAFADAATLVDAARLLLWDAARAGRSGDGSAAAARGMARLQALDAAREALIAAQHATDLEASRPGAPLERLGRDAATLARVLGDDTAVQHAVAAVVLPAGAGAR